MLTAITVLETIVVAAYTGYFDPELVLLAIGILAVTVASLFVAALFTPLDRNLVKYLILGLVISVVLQIMFLVMLFMYDKLSNGVYIAYAVLGIILSGIYILVDFVVLLKPGVYDMDDYILGSLTLYLDIIRMFIYILMLLGRSR